MSIEEGTFSDLTDLEVQNLTYIFFIYETLLMHSTKTLTSISFSPVIIAGD